MPRRAASRRVEMQRYAASADWRRDRNRGVCPYTDGLRAQLWRLLKLTDGRPVGQERIRTVVCRTPLFSTHEP
jgi:hypothetical protein